MRNYDPNRIRLRRKNLGLTQEELAKKVGTGREHIAAIELGKKIPRAAMLAKIAHALKVRVSYFFH